MKVTLTSLLSAYFITLRMDNWSLTTIDRRNYSLGRFIAWCAERGVDSPEDFAAANELLEAYRRSSLPPFAVPSSQSPHRQADQVRDPGQLPDRSQALTRLDGRNLTTSNGVRDRAILETFYTTAIRRAELLKLNLDDVDREQGLVLIRQGKEESKGTGVIYNKIGETTPVPFDSSGDHQIDAQR